MRRKRRDVLQRHWYFIAEEPAPAQHLPHPEGCAALLIVLVTVPRISRSCEHFPDGLELHLLRCLAPPLGGALSRLFRPGTD